MLTGLNHITIAMNDISRSFNFYVETLGFTPKAKWASGAYLCLGDLWRFKNCLAKLSDGQIYLVNSGEHIDSCSL
ncbi:VOC family protein [Citrobacter portucalensis]|uniref:VOC family protein n=1 Tax=Citrobacter portucalensis TaxID=1639133 RepID=UPI003908B2AD